MSLDNIQLPAFIIQDLFQSSLIDITDILPVKSNKKNKDINFFGGNNQQIVIVVNNIKEEFISPIQLNFLSGILNACKLNLEDVAIVNLAAHTSINYHQLSEALSCKMVLLFGIMPGAIQLPFVIPEFQKQIHANCLYLSAPSLNEMENNKELKKKLWLILKQIFSI